MDAQAATLLNTLKRPAAPSTAKLDALNALKSDIKHCRVPETAQATIFECLKLAIAQQVSSSLALSAFSTLGHLVKRLKIQDTTGHAITQLAPRLFPALQERLGDLKEPIRTASSHALSELYPFLPQDVEHIIREEAMGGSNVRAKEAAMQWVVRMHREASMPFKSYTSSIVARLEDSDGNTREAAKSALIELFSNAPDRAKTDLKRQLKAHSVRHSIQTQILSQIGAETAAPSRPQTRGDVEVDAELATSTRSLPTIDHAAHLAESINSEAARPPPQEAVQMDPLYVHSERELNETFRDMLPFFEGREDEENWIPRDKSVLKIRRLLKGNAANEYHQAFLAGLKSVMDGIIKVANSLRTTMSSNGCQLVQELAQTMGPALDPHVEILLQNFVKMSAQTKPIAAQNGRVTSDAIFQNCSFHKGMMQHIWYAAQEKNVQLRQCVPEWLKTILKRQASYKQHFESTGGLELAEKTIKKLLEDPKPTVKQEMRATYWTFARSWPDRAEKIMAGLDPQAKTALQKDPNNPNASLHASQTSLSASTSRPGGSRMGMRELIAEQRKAKAAGKFPDRPNSAMAQLSPAKPRVPASTTSTTRPSHLRTENRVTSTASNVSETPTDAKSVPASKRSALMSGPVRRPRRPEMPRPQTADPYASKRMMRPETPANGSPTSPPKGTAGSRTSIPTSSAIRNRSRTAGNLAASASGSPIKRSPMLSHAHPPAEHLQSPRPSSKGSTGTHGDDLTSVREEDFTMVLPNGKGSVTTSRGAFVLAHKRPGLGQTMSVDSGIPAVAEEDGFTMVMPNIPGRPLPRARSPLAFRSPLKAMFEEARDKLERSASPPRERLNGIDEAMEAANQPRAPSPVKSGTPQPEEIQIYEDPFTNGAPEGAAGGEGKVLGELQANENVRVQSPTHSQGSSTSPAGSPMQVPEPASASVEQTAQDRAEVMRSKRLLASGIERIRTKTLDAHGFRRVQDLVKSNLDIWEEGRKYDELLSVLLEYLRTFDQDPKLTQPPHKAAGLKTQALGLVRALLTLQRKSAQGWQAKALVTIFACRKGVETNSHMVTDIEKSAEDIVKQASPEQCIDATIDFLPEVGNDRGASRSVAMALTTLRRLLETAKQRSVDLGSERKVLLTQAAAKYLDDPDAEVRKADVELASDLFELFGSSKAEFWSEFKGTDEGRLGLLTYYIARRGKVEGIVPQ
jgi:CLIP-associating protein 1/2